MEHQAWQSRVECFGNLNQLRNTVGNGMVLPCAEI